jgi:hypothetical protein
MRSVETFTLELLQAVSLLWRICWPPSKYVSATWWWKKKLAKKAFPFTGRGRARPYLCLRECPRVRYPCELRLAGGATPEGSSRREIRNLSYLEYFPLNGTLIVAHQKLIKPAAMLIGSRTGFSLSASCAGEI